ncbi:MAG TPA: bifunctional DNA-formamidopyrimidine glycosylase/DNA-(apurinic or apyrimidinic site) lyase [Polaromonas sp.]|uniref:bifunctional DNA-formamidopyrimidine glycosylase/DNA-(apurinic or apyrimidinic site) lyase n=1 Tax=Polaromonas sp. TaxID=1869339 RepID=UPI002D3BADD3|nr:bifunctional DNA-formamidopyrimidine glycosylase/DNA-(apurinic or apyrimidinic site) lyase [Polaromonas sp.]HYW58526.1 bifunctional DNA-formamidopyrimidine glycosylase/DNA-(apurinic or apyrimidinic site) lyase [Polaromonas sp.]
MPELPEVEVTRLSFADRISGAQIMGVQMGKPLRWPLGCDVSHLEGHTVHQVRRRGKYLLLDTSGGLLLIHLGMSGSLSFGADLSPAGKHDHFEMQTTAGHLRLHDPRRFGAVVYAPAEDHPTARKLLGRLGVEPLTDDFLPEGFHHALQKKQSAIKQVLLGGEIVVGVGNIYASEALFLAGIRPTVRAARLSKPRAVRLHAAIRTVLSQALAKGGSTLKDFSNAQGESGYFQLDAMVYDRAGLPCRVCAAPIKTIRQGQRSTFFCVNCQKP